ncbi:MAG: HesA/MoeB/ThiF family protein [Geminicoccaceae bacterium]|nr:HesA/MoeB/ThiF family protein [Geminicoccaceae bacterium]
MRELTEDEIRRYARHIVLPEIGGVGQSRLLAARVLVIGAGGLGSPLLLYLAAAGIGTLGVVDFDRVDPSNLQRQILFDEADAGTCKVVAAARRIAALNPAVRVIALAARLDRANARTLVEGWDLVADGCDDPSTRRIVHDACMAAGKPLVSASVQGTDGQITTYKAFLGPPHPCMRCVFREVPERGALPSCAQAGVLGPAAGVVGCLQAVEVIKELLGDAGSSASGTLLLYDAMIPRLERVRIHRRPECEDGCVHGDDPPDAGRRPAPPSPAIAE